MYNLFILSLQYKTGKETTMTTNNKYQVCLAPSGWAVYDRTTGIKVKGFSSRSFGRIDALTYMYQLNGWNLPKGGFRS